MLGFPAGKNEIFAHLRRQVKILNLLMSKHSVLLLDIANSAEPENVLLKFEKKQIEILFHKFYACWWCFSLFLLQMLD